MIRSLNIRDTSSKTNECKSSRLNLAFVLFTNIAIGAGTETTILAYVKNLKEMDQDLKITIVQTDAMFTSNNKPIEKLRDIDVITFKSPHAMKVYRLLEQFPSIYYLIYIFIYIILNNKKIRSISKECDVIYFVNQLDILPWGIFNPNVRSKTVISGQCGFFSNFSNKIQGKLSFRKILGKLSFKLYNKYPFSLHYLTKLQMLDVGRNEKQDFLLPSGVETDNFHPINRNDDVTSFVYFGRVDKSKGVPELLEAFKKYPFTDSTLTIIGTGDTAKAVESQKSKNIKYLGYIDRESLYREIPNYDIFIFPTHGDIFPLVVVEAVSSGLFCLVSDNLKGIFDDLESIGAIEYISNTVDGILQAMIKYHGFKVLYEKKLEWHEFIKEHYDWKDISRRLYEKLMVIAKRKE